MKKRIISLVLAVVMLVGALVGCGSYDFADDDMTKYASFDKTAFLNALKDGTLEIADGDFTTDPDTREKKTMDAIIAALGSKADKGDEDKKTEGKPEGYDLFYYAYYITAKVDGKDFVFTVDTMVNGKAEETQLGISFPSDLEGKILELYKDYEFTKDTSYAPITDGKTKAGQLVFVSYTRSYTANDAAGSVQKVVATKHPLVLDESNLFAAKLIDKAIGTKLTDTIKVEVADKTAAEYELYAGEYSNVKIEWAVNDGAAKKTFTEVTYDEEKKVSPTLVINDTKTKDLKNVELTYHVYPACFVDVGEFTAEAVINSIYGASITFASMKSILFGADFADKTEDEQKAELDKYKFTVDGESVSLEEFVSILDTAQQAVVDKEKAFDTAKSALDTKKSEYETAEKAVETAQKTVDEAGAGATDSQKKALETAKATRDTKKTAYETAKETYDKADSELKKAESDRKTKTDILFAKISGETITKGYKENVVFEGLLTSYNTGIKESLATKVFELMKKYTTLSTRPEKAVKEAEEYLIQNYEYCFYKNVKLDSSSSSSSTTEEETFYSKYDGSFQNFLTTYAVPNDLEVKVETYEEALAAIRKAAEAHVDEMIVIYSVAAAFGVTVTDEDYEAYIESEDYDYTKEAYNGAEAARFAYQFDQVLDHILESEEKDGGKTVTYKNVTFKLTEEEEHDHDHDHEH